MAGRPWLPPLVTMGLILAPMPLLAQRYRLLPNLFIVSCVLLTIGIAISVVAVRSERTVRALLGGAVGLALVADLFGAVALIGTIVRTGSLLLGGPLLLSAMQSWIGNVAGFALLYWYLNEVMRPADAAPRLLFPEPDAAQRTHNILDYLFVAATTALAFGPTDTPPATTLTRCAMLVEAVISFVVVALVAARAINAIG